MSEERRRASVNGKPSSEDRKPASPSADKRVIVKSADMADDLQNEAVAIAIAAFEKNNVEKDVAESIKKEFDKKHGPTWHCIVGRNFDCLYFNRLKQDRVLSNILNEHDAFKNNDSDGREWWLTMTIHEDS